VAWSTDPGIPTPTPHERAGADVADRADRVDDRREHGPAVGIGAQPGRTDVQGLPGEIRDHGPHGGVTDVHADRTTGLRHQSVQRRRPSLPAGVRAALGHQSPLAQPREDLGDRGDRHVQLLGEVPARDVLGAAGNGEHGGIIGAPQEVEVRAAAHPAIIGDDTRHRDVAQIMPRSRDPTPSPPPIKKQCCFRLVR
jgi:hypothetical protein